MSLFQCDKCGARDNTACGWYHARNNERLTKKEFLGLKLCACCAPREYPSGEKTSFNGDWHNRFQRMILPIGEFFTNREGNLEHKETGLLCGEFAKIHPDKVIIEPPK